MVGSCATFLLVSQPCFGIFKPPRDNLAGTGQSSGRDPRLPTDFGGRRAGFSRRPCNFFQVGPHHAGARATITTLDSMGTFVPGPAGIVHSQRFGGGVGGCLSSLVHFACGSPAR